MNSVSQVYFNTGMSDCQWRIIMEMTLEQAEKEFVLNRKHGKIHIKKSDISVNRLFVSVRN